MRKKRNSLIKVILMLRIPGRAFTGLLIIVLLTLTGSLRTSFAASLAPRDRQHAHNQFGNTFLPLTTFHLRGIDGPYHTQGNLILGADNHPYLFHGIARDDLEYFCKGDGHYDEQELAYLGPGISTAKETYWSGNVVRLPLSEGFWLYGHPSENCAPQQYQALVKQTIDALTALNMNVIINLQWNDAGGQARGSGTQLAMPDADSVTFWKQVAPIYASYSNVLFELFNEPDIYNWVCWMNGCQVTGDVGTNNQTYSYPGVGMQKLVETVRRAGANNLVLVGGLDWGYDLSQLPTYHLQGSNIVYDTHPYDYYGKQPINWDASFGNISSSYPVFAAEFGEYDCGTNYTSQLINYFDAHNISWVGWAWVVANADPCAYPQVIRTYNGTPIPGMGQWEYQHLQGYLALLVKAEVPERI